MGQIHTYGPQSYPEDMRYVMWSIAMAGGYANWYVGTTAWDVIVPGDVTPGYAYCRHLVDFFVSAQYWLLEPSDGIVQVAAGDAGYALADPRGSEVLIYVTGSSTVFSVDLPGKAGTAWTGEWFDPATGQRQGLNVSTGAPQLTAPSFATHGQSNMTRDVALRLVRAA